MNDRFAYLMAAGLTLAAGSPALSASQIRNADPSVDILVGDAPQPRYAYGGRWYVEARKGKEYAIRLRNPYGVRVAVALSVDGLNTIDARETTAAGARKWVLDPYETITISGWQTSQTQARRFEFTTEEKSYGQALGRAANLGMISAVFFKERLPQEAGNRSYRTAPDAPRPSMPNELGAASPAAADSKAKEEYAATGMGRRTDHAVTQVWLDLEDAPAQDVNIRYEFRPQLVKLGILRPTLPPDPLQRRENARGFEAGFSPEPPRQR